MSCISDFKILKKLGEGSFSEVYRVQRISDKSVYAMKKVKMGKLTAKEKENALNEVRILASINHVNVIGYKDAFFEDDTRSLCIVMEDATGGDLLEQINRHKKNHTNFTEKQCWHYFIQMVRGLKALHDLKICHRDIKCANIFLTKEGVVKLGDLNVSKVAKGGMLRTQTGTPYYACPEVWKDMPYDNRSDIWSMGCVLYEMITKLPPFRAQTMKGLYTKVISGKYEPLPAHYSKDLKDVIGKCLKTRASERTTADKLLAMPGLLNHVTGTLEDIEAYKDENESLLKTIRMPRRRGEITDRLPESQYDQQPKLKRTNSQPQAKMEAIAEEVLRKPGMDQLDVKPHPQIRKQMPVSKSTSNVLNDAANPTNNLIKKAHALYDNKPTTKLTSVANRAQRQIVAPDLDLPTIDEAEQKDEQNTFAMGGPMQALAIARKVQPLASRAAVSRSRSGVRSAGLVKQPSNNPKSAEISIGKQIKLYREPGDNSSNLSALEKLKEHKQRAMHLVYGSAHESQTPNKLPHQRPLLVNNQLSQKFMLPQIQSTKQSAVRNSNQQLSALSRHSRNESERFATRLSMQNKPPLNLLVKESGDKMGDGIVSQPLQAKYLSRPQSNQRAIGIDVEPYQPPVSRALSRRSENSSLAHIRRIRKNMPSSQNMRPHQADLENIGNVKMEAAGLNLDNYRKIKQEEAQARARLLADVPRYGQKKIQQVRPLQYRPSNQALNQYSPIRQQLNAHPHQSSSIIGSHYHVSQSMNAGKPGENQSYDVRQIR